MTRPVLYSMPISHWCVSADRMLAFKGVAFVLEQWSHAVTEEKVWRYVVTKIPPVLRDDHERWVFEEMQTRARGPWHVLEMRREEFRKDMVTALAMVEAMLEGKDWMLGTPSLP